MRNYSFILWRYTAIHFLLSFVALLLILLGIVYIFDIIELLRRASKLDGVGIGIVAHMAILKLPEVGQVLLPFAVLFSAMYSFWTLNKKSEIIIMRSSGISAWHFLTPSLFSAFFIGVIAITILNPLSSILLQKYQTMEELHLKKKSHFVALLQNGLWLRQNDPEGYALIYAKEFEPHSWNLSDVISFTFDTEDNFIQRIDGSKAELMDGYWNISQAVIHKNTPKPERIDTYRYPTTLTAQEIDDSFASPETLSFWEIPNFIKKMEETGVSTSTLKVHFQSLLSRPLFFLSMVLLAATVSLRPVRQGNSGFLIVSGIALGFAVLFIETVLQAFGISQKLPITLAAWTPALLTTLLGTVAILTLEDG